MRYSPALPRPYSATGGPSVWVTTMGAAKRPGGRRAIRVSATALSTVSIDSLRPRPQPPPCTWIDSPSLRPAGFFWGSSPPSAQASEHATEARMKGTRIPRRTQSAARAL